MSSVIHLQDIRKNYYMGKQELQVLKGVTLDITRNEYVALMGPSGSGKSTLMNILGCLDSPTSGTYILNDNDVSKMADNDLALGRIAHDSVLSSLGVRRSQFPFGHGAAHAPIPGIRLYDSYHCSRYNTSTRVLTPEMFREVLSSIADDLAISKATRPRA